MLTLESLRHIMPAAGARAAVYFDYLTAAMEEFAIDSGLERAAFLANVGHESGQLSRVDENLNYSAEGLMRTWPKRFPNLDFATYYARHPAAIANYVYADRGGNGDESSGDGWTHRGAGLIQVTFKANQAECAAHFGIDIESIGDWLRTPEGAARSAGWFWWKHGCGRYAAAGDFDGCCDVINLGHKTDKVGDAIGYADRLAMYQRALEVYEA